jgi:hypothetical protein
MRYVHKNHFTEPLCKKILNTVSIIIIIIIIIIKYCRAILPRVVKLWCIKRKKGRKLHDSVLSDGCVYNMECGIDIFNCSIIYIYICRYVQL